MRLTVALEGNSEGKILTSVDMEEIIKMTITDDIEKSNFNPQMLKSCTDTSYQCGYQQGREDERKKIIEIFDSADDTMQAVHLLMQYIISEELKDDKGNKRNKN